MLSLVVLSCSKSKFDNTHNPEKVDISHVLDKGLPPKDYSYPSTAYDLTRALPDGFVRDASVDYTSHLQAAIDKNSVVVFPDFPILISKPGLRLRNGSQVYFQKNSQLRMSPTASSQYYMILLLDVQDVYLKNVNLMGDRNNHLGTTGEWGMGIYISGCKNIKIEGAYITNCWGDGIILTKDGWNKASQDIHIINSLIDSNRRSGITIGSGIDVHIENTIMQNSNGPSISSGFTIEPNDRTNDVNNITVKNCITKNNQRVGIRLVPANLYGSEGALKDCNIQFINHKDIASQFGITFVLGSPSKKGGLNPSQILFQNCFLVNNKTAIADYTVAGSEVKFDVYFDKLYSVNEKGEVNETQMNKIENLINKTDYFHYK